MGQSTSKYYKGGKWFYKTVTCDKT